MYRMTARAYRGAGKAVIAAGLAAVGCLTATATAHADAAVGPMREYWCPAEYFMSCDVWHSEFFQSPLMQSPLWQNPMVRVPWQSDGYD